MQFKKFQATAARNYQEQLMSRLPEIFPNPFQRDIARLYAMKDFREKLAAILEPFVDQPRNTRLGESLSAEQDCQRREQLVELVRISLLSHLAPEFYAPIQGKIDRARQPEAVGRKLKKECRDLMAEDDVTDYETLMHFEFNLSPEQQKQYKILACRLLQKTVHTLNYGVFLDMAEVLGWRPKDEKRVRKKK